MNVTQTTLPLHHRGMLEVVNLFDSENPDFAGQMVDREINTDQLYEEIGSWSGLGAAVDLREAGAIPFDEATSPFQKKFFPQIKVIGFEMSDIAYETDQYGKYKSWAQMFAQSHYWTEQQTAADTVINYMISANADRLGMDGVSLVSASHPTKSSTWSNRGANDPHLGPLTIEQAMNEMMDQMSYRDQPFPQTGPFDLIVGTPNQGIANRIYSTQKMPGSNDNDTNWAGSRLRKVIVNPFITQKYFWQIKSAAKNNQGLFRLSRRGIRIREGFDIRTNAMLMTATKVYLRSWIMANGIWGSAAVLS